MNLAFVSAPVALRTVPYSTLGAGFVILNGVEPLFQFSVLNPTSTVSTTGFNDLFEEGVTLAAELRLPTSFFDLPGHQLFGGTWSSRTYVALDQDPRIIIPGLNVPINEQEGSWSAYWNFDQYLVASSETPGAGWGVFGRAGVADDQTNPIEAFLSFGVGGTSPIRCREKDGWGVGWYLARGSDQLGPAVDALLQLDDGQGVELFYNIAVTPFFNLTADLQIIEPGAGIFDTAIVPGIRGKLVL
jgi:porin